MKMVSFFLVLLLLSVSSSKAEIIRHYSLTNHLSNGYSILLEVERDDTPSVSADNTRNSVFEDRFQMSCLTPDGKTTILNTIRKVGMPTVSNSKVSLDFPFMIEPLDFLEIQGGKIGILLQQYAIAERHISPCILLEVWKPTENQTFIKQYESCIFLFSNNDAVHGGCFFTTNGTSYAVLCVEGIFYDDGGHGFPTFDFWRMDENRAIRESICPMPIPSEWQHVTNRLISVSTNHLSDGYIFVAKTERNYNWKNLLKEEKRRETNPDLKTHPVLSNWRNLWEVPFNWKSSLTALQQFTWTILGPDGQKIGIQQHSCPYYSAQGLFWPHADTNPDRILDVYRNKKGDIYVTSERFDGLVADVFTHNRWRGLHVNTRFGIVAFCPARNAILRPISKAKFYPFEDSLVLRIDFEDGTTDYWKIDGLEAEKLQEPPPGLKKQASQRDDAG